MPTDHVQTPTRPAVEPIVPVAPTPEENSTLRFLRDTMVADVEIHPVPQGWHLYTTARAMGQAALGAYAFTVLSVWLVPLLMKGSWLPIIFSQEAAIFGLPVAVAGGWIAATSIPEPELDAKRTWLGRLYAAAVAYLLIQTVAILFSFVWMNIFVFKPYR